MLGKSSAFYNPLIYLFMYKQFRQAVSELFGRQVKVGPISSQNTIITVRRRNGNDTSIQTENM